MDEFIQFLCPNCQKKLKHREAGKRVVCHHCDNVAIVPDRTQLPQSVPDLSVGSQPRAEAGSTAPPILVATILPDRTEPPRTAPEFSGDAQADDEQTSTKPSFSVYWLVLIPAGLLGLASILTCIGFAALSWVVGACFLVLSVMLACVTAKVVVDLLTAKARAIEHGYREVTLFFRCVRLILWEQNEGLVLLRDKKIRDVIYGPEQGGGTKFIFPIVGDEVKVHVPLTLQMSTFEDRNVSTRDGVQLFVKIAFWWRLKDKAGLKKFYLLVDREVRQSTDTGAERVRDYNPPPLPNRRKEPRRGELDATERWMRTILESITRKHISQQSFAFVLSNEASAYLQVNHQASPTPMPATPNQLGSFLQTALDQEAGAYGVTVERIEVQEVRLPDEIQRKIERVLIAALTPAESGHLAKAREMEIRAELETIKNILGGDAAAVGHVMGKMAGMRIVGGLPETLQKMITKMATSEDVPKLLGENPKAATKPPEQLLT